MRPREVSVGDRFGPLEVTVTRAGLVRYAGASRDFNPIHWNDRVAYAVGLPGVIAHGMLTMAHGGRLVSAWAGDPAAVVEYGVRFTRPVPVPEEGGAVVEFTGKVTAVEPASVTVLVTATYDGKSVFGKAEARVRTP